MKSKDSTSDSLRPKRPPPVVVRLPSSNSRPSQAISIAAKKQFLASQVSRLVGDSHTANAAEPSNAKRRDDDFDIDNLKVNPREVERLGGALLRGHHRLEFEWRQLCSLGAKSKTKPPKRPSHAAPATTATPASTSSPASTHPAREGKSRSGGAVKHKRPRDGERGLKEVVGHFKEGTLHVNTNLQKRILSKKAARTALTATRAVASGSSRTPNRSSSKHQPRKRARK